jgi:hypothetical protein
VVCFFPVPKGSPDRKRGHGTIGLTKWPVSASRVPPSLIQPDCGEVTELYDYLIDKILQAPEPGIPSVKVLSYFTSVTRIPTLDARRHYWQKVWAYREARYRLTYRPTK